MKTKLKLKNKFKVLILLIVIGAFSIIYFKNQYEISLYQETYEYKFLEIGYTEDEYNILLDNFSEYKLEEFLNEEYDENIFKLLEETYYLEKNFDLYLEYFYSEDVSLTDAVAIINVGVNYDFYENVVETDTSLGELMLINKYNYLTNDYVIDDLVSVSTKYSWGEYGSQQIKSDVYDAFVDMAYEIYSSEGISLMVNSSYRSYDSQEEVYETYKNSYGSYYADSVAARAGYSEHQSGYALDIFSLDASSQSVFFESDAYLWLKDNSYKFGFILRYPEDKEYLTGYSFESWHYRYVGIDVATYIYENDITFDEYYAYFIAN